MRKNLSVGVVFIFIIGAAWIHFEKLSAYILEKRVDSLDEEVPIIMDKYAAVSEFLQPCGEVGYVTDLNSKKAPVVYGKHFVLARFALSPALLIDSRAPSLIVGNFTEPGRAYARIKEMKLAVIRDFGEGVFLLKSQ